MKNKFKAICFAFVFVFSFFCTKTSQENTVRWHHPLYMANNNYWRQRIPVSIRNNLNRDLIGDPVGLRIGNSRGQAPLVGIPAEEIRVTTLDGGELTFRITDQHDNIIEKGPIPGNSKIIFPVECKSKAATTNFIYFDNPSAWAVGDYYKTHLDILNGGFEAETSLGPLGWEFSLPNGGNFVEFAKGEARSGDRSILINISKASVTTPFGATQRNLHLFSGVKYVVEAWIKGENITGNAQIGVVFGDLNSEKFTLGVQKINGGTGTFDWEKVTFEFTAPEKSNGAYLQILLEGNGKAWFDDLKITCAQDYSVTAEIQKKEKLLLKEIRKTDKWFDDNISDQSIWQSRSAIKTVNLQENDLFDKLICVDIEGVVNRLYSEINENTSLQVTDGLTPVPFYRVGDYILFKQDIDGSSEKTNYIYFSSDELNVRSLGVNSVNDLDQNLIKNPGFENADLSDWKGNIEQGIADISGREGKRCIELNHVKGETNKEVMIEQTLPVKADITYFFSAWMKCSDMIKQPDFLAGISQRTLRAQFLTEDGTVVGKLNRIAVTPERHMDNAWSQLYMLITAPPKAHFVKLQLVNSAPGTAWFDDVIFTEVIRGVTSPLAIERFGSGNLKELIA